MGQSPYIQRVKVVDGNATESGTVSNPMIISGNVTSSGGAGGSDQINIADVNFSGSQTDEVKVFGSNLSIAEASNVTLASQTSPFTDDVNVSLGAEVVTVNANQSGTWNVGTVTTLQNASITGALPAGDNNIGNVDIVTIPSMNVSNTVTVTGSNLTLAQGNMTSTVAWDNATTTLAYDSQNNATEIVESRSDETKTTALGYDAQNNATQITETVS